MLAGLATALLCPDAGDGLMAGLDTGDLLVAGAAELETAEAGVPATRVALPVSLLGSADLAWGLAAVLPSAFVVAPTLVSPMERATGLSAAGLAAAFTGAVAAVLAVVAGDDVPVDFTTIFCTGWAAVGFTDAGTADFLATAGVVLTAAFVVTLLAVLATGLVPALLDFSPCSCCFAADSNKPRTSWEA